MRAKYNRLFKSNNFLSCNYSELQIAEKENIFHYEKRKD